MAGFARRSEGLWNGGADPCRPWAAQDKIAYQQSEEDNRSESLRAESRRTATIGDRTEHEEPEISLHQEGQTGSSFRWSGKEIIREKSIRLSKGEKMEEMFKYVC